jgi:hypothetical protein
VLFTRPHNNRPLHIAFLDLRIREGILYGYYNDITNAGSLSFTTAQDLDALNFLCTTVVRNIQV